MSSKNPWSIADGKAVVSNTDDPPLQLTGRTLRTPRAHVSRTNEKNPGIVTKVPARVYEAASPGSQEAMRTLIQKDVDELADKAHAKAGKSKASKSSSGRPVKESKGGSSAAGTSESTPNPKVNSKGQPVPPPSPEDLLTDDRTGEAGSSFLLSPVSYGRTKRLRSDD